MYILFFLQLSCQNLAPVPSCFQLSYCCIFLHIICTFPQKQLVEIGVHIICKECRYQYVCKFGSRGAVAVLIAMALGPGPGPDMPVSPQAPSGIQGWEQACLFSCCNSVTTRNIFFFMLPFKNRCVFYMGVLLHARKYSKTL